MSYKFIGLYGNFGHGTDTIFPQKKDDIVYTQLADTFYHNGYLLVRLMSSGWDMQTHTFAFGWVYNGSGGRESIFNPVLSIIFCKNNDVSFIRACIAKYFLSYNSLELITFMKDKQIVSHYLHDRCPISLNFEKIKDHNSTNIIPGEDIIVKPRFGSLGNGVKKIKKQDLVLYKEEYIQKEYHIYNKIEHMIAQEFIDSSGGIPGLLQGIHDVRAMIFGKNIGYYTIRQPEGGDFRCNLAQGGSSKNILPSQLPIVYHEQIEKIVEKINLFCDFYHGIYSIDFFIGSNGDLKIIELNSNPGYGHLMDDEFFRNLYCELFYENFQQFYTKKV